MCIILYYSNNITRILLRNGQRVNGKCRFESRLRNLIEWNNEYTHVCGLHPSLTGFGFRAVELQPLSVLYTYIRVLPGFCSRKVRWRQIQ